MAKRLSKEQLETDPLLTSYYIFVSFIKRNMTAVIAVSVAVLVIVGGGIYYYLHSQAQEQEAQELLAQVDPAFQAGDYEIALEGGSTRITVGLIDIINNYGRTNAGNMARYYAAVAESELGNYAQARYYIERFNPPEGILGVGPIALHGVILANLGEFEEAADIFVKAAEWDKNNSTTPQNLLQAAQVSMEANNYSRATEYVNRILRDYPDSEFVDRARRLEGMLLARG
ncbi:tetratricopeptide repeat protein [Balneolales bacterium ANBcel1]|nr:tetratricopeptide repeat protein [Balneolales bacterium ANBcel1]